MLVKVTGTNYVRDTSSMALLNSDKKGLDDYMKRRSVFESQRNEINNIKDEINGIKSDVTEIKDLMRQLLEKGSNG